MRGQFSPNRRSKLIAAFLLVALVVNLIGIVGRAVATTCGDYDCVDQSEFSTDDPAHNGWVPSLNSDLISDTELGWLASKSFGTLWWGTSADGVLTARGGGPHVYKSIYMQPGTYRMVMRVGSDDWGIFGGPPLFATATPAGGTSYGLGGFNVSDTFSTFISDEFSVSSPSDVSFEIGVGSRTKLYFDYVWIVQNTTATPTPGAGTPTATSIPAASTPIPTGTPYCITVSPTPTPGPPQFELTPTATPTPPDPDTNWTVLDTFPTISLSNIWTVAGSGVYVSLSAGRATTVPGAVFIPYSVAPGGWDHLSMERDALVWQPSAVLSGTIYADGWGRTDFVPEGTSAYSEIWLLDGGTLQWSQVYTTQVSGSYWYPFHSSLTSAGGIVALAFLSSRSDAAISGGVYLDDIYLYGALANAPDCNGNYINPQTGSGTTSTPITFPADKPCPPDLKVPNNFWGPLLANLTIVLDGIFAFSPLHNNLNLAGTVHDLINAPIFIYLQLMAMLFDLRIPLAVLGVIVAVNIADTIYDLWIKVKNAIPFL